LPGSWFDADVHSGDAAARQIAEQILENMPCSAGKVRATEARKRVLIATT